MQVTSFTRQGRSSSSRQTLVTRMLFFPFQNISPSEAISKVPVGKARPHALIGLSPSWGPQTTTAPVDSDIPNTSSSGMSRERKYQVVSMGRGAAPAYKRSHRSSPQPRRTLRKASSLKKPKGITSRPHLTSSGVSELHPCASNSFGSSSNVLEEFSSDFVLIRLGCSDLHGCCHLFPNARYPKNKLGLTRSSVSLRLPLRALGRRVDIDNVTQWKIRHYSCSLC